MSKDDVLYKKVQASWAKTGQNVRDTYSKLGKNNRKVRQMLPKPNMKFTDPLAAVWQQIDVLDELILQRDAENILFISALQTLLTAWEDHAGDDSAMTVAAKRFLDIDVAEISKSMKSDRLILNAVSELRNLVWATHGLSSSESNRRNAA